MELREDDLSSLANSLAELLGAPVTIEDTETTVVAYSGGDSAAQAVDEARIGTILRRKVPDRYRDALTAAGVFERLARESGVVWVDLPDASMTPRAVIAVREGDTLLGSIWAAMPTAPTPEQTRVLQSAVPIVARHVLRDRDRADASRRRRTELLESLFSGGDDALRAVEDAGLRPPMSVVALARADPDASLSPRVLGSLTLHLEAVASRSLSAQLGDVVYAVVSADEAHTVRAMNDFLNRSRHPQHQVVAVGRPASSPAEVAWSRADADAVLRALQRSGRAGVVSTLQGSFAAVLALRAAEAFDGIEQISPLTALEAFDDEHHSELVASAQAYLTHGGDIAAAAGSLHVHPNTLRNRLRRAVHACAIDLDDPDTRLVLMLHLKIRSLR